MERTVILKDKVFCPLVALNARPIANCIEPPCEFFIKETHGCWYGIIHCSKTKEVYDEHNS